MSSLESDLKKEKKREIPSHVGILGNEKAVAAAKSALSLPVTRMKLSATDILVCSRPTLNGADNWQTFKLQKCLNNISRSYVQ